ncbi:MAG TPA: dodecin [Dehalococcoidia bacterium]|nr:dodecin [Dehalococcoidia bacterium]
MAGHTYKTIDLVGTSSESVTDAIESAVNRAGQTLKGLAWFEVGQIRGEIVDGSVAWYQVAVKIGFRVMSDEELRPQ